MANCKAALKSIRQNSKRRAQNTSQRSAIRTSIRKVEEAITAKKKDDAKATFRNMESLLMRGVKNNLYHASTAARKVSQFSARIKAL